MKFVKIDNYIIKKEEIVSVHFYDYKSSDTVYIIDIDLSCDTLHRITYDDSQKAINDFDKLFYDLNAL